MKVKTEAITATDLKKVKRVKKPKEKKIRDIRGVFRAKLAALAAEGGISKLTKSWMHTKDLRIIDTADDLRKYVADVLANAPRIEFYGRTLPVVALDTETLGLDTRLFIRLKQQSDGTYKQVYEIKTDIAGICLSADGMLGIYIPISHEFQDINLTIPAKNIDRAECAEILQEFFNQVHLVFYNGKFDREIMRLTMGITFQGYPRFEDVQVLQYINDPKADVGDRKHYTGDAGGLKSLSKKILDIEQIELKELAEVKAEYCPIEQSPYCDCTDEEKKAHPHTLKNAFCPFSWIPVELAKIYAAPDGICTRLLWGKMYEKARGRRTAHRIDHELVDSLTWVERQRYFIDTDRLARTIKGHEKRVTSLHDKLYDLGIKAGYKETSTDDGVVLDEDRFNPGSNKQLQTLFFDVLKWTPTKLTPTKTPSCDAEALEDLLKLHPNDEFLTTLLEYRDYKALHPSDLRFDPSDKSARLYLKQNVVAGGRLSSAGGDFEKDGGFGLNSQAIKKVESHLMWKVQGNILSPDEIAPEHITLYEEADLNPSCFKDVKDKQGVVTRKKAPGIINNHIGQYLGYTVCLVPKCTSCAGKFGILIPDTKIDANEIVNIRCLFHSQPGWTFFTVDYGNIEMRAAANCSQEPEFVNEFINGKGDFHTLTASKVFPEFNDPTHKNYRAKFLRDLAKIINFALLYGGTEHTIFENMKKQDPEMTMDRAKEMVANYWKGVPVFYLWCENKKAIAKGQMTCTTTTGRIIDFKSAMESLHIWPPTEEEQKNYYQYRDLMRQSKKAFEEEGETSERGKQFKKLADSMWRNPDTGVRNAMDYNKFLGKIQRVSINIPLQGLAGDFMRMTLNGVRLWVERDPSVAKVFSLHGSVHDEVDFSVKDEYAPFVLPRITRIMKLRPLHKKLKWPVPIECDAEYGPSWDVLYHLTGDDDHIPIAWTKIPSMANYIPEGWDVDTLKNLIKAIASGSADKIAKADTFLKENLHERAYIAAWHCFNKKKGKTESEPRTDPKEIKTALVAALQLDEYWRIDETPDEDEDKLETLAQYEARMGLDPTEYHNQYSLTTGPLGSIPLDSEIVYPPKHILGSAPILVAPLPEALAEAIMEQPTLGLIMPEEVAEKAPEALPEPIIEEILPETPPPEPPSFVEAPPDGTKVFELRELTDSERQQLKLRLGLGAKVIWVKLGNEVFSLKARIDHIPDKFLKKADSL